MTDDSGVPTPPLYWRLAYRLLSRRLPEEYGPWVAADATRPGWQVRITLTKYLNTIILFLVGVLVWHTARDRWPPLPVFLFGGGVLVLMAYDYVRTLRRPVTSRKEIFDHQGIDKFGNPSPVATGPLGRLRLQLLPRRDFEAIGYIVVVVLGLNAAAAIGINKRADDPPVAKVKPDCVEVDDEVRDAIAGTLKSGVTIKEIQGQKFEDDLTVAARLLAPGKPGEPTLVWLVRGEGRGVQVHELDTQPDTDDLSNAPTLEVASNTDLSIAAALGLSCVFSKHRR